MFGLRKIDRIKRNHPIEQVIQSYGIELKQRGQSLIGLCPFHDDKTPSLSVTPEKGLFHCFGCSAGGDVITFVEKIENISNKEAIQRLDVDTFIPNRRIEPPKIKQEEVPSKLTTKGELLKEIARVYHETFKKSKVARNYLKSRGFENLDYYSRFQIGYCDGGTIKNMLPKSGQMIDLLKEMGILNDKGNPSFYKCVIFPIKDTNGNIQSFYGRAIEDKRQCYTKGSRNAVWNSEIIKSHSKLIITESILDAYSLIEIGFINVLPIYGTSGFTKDHLDLLQNSSVEELIFCLDNDKAGNESLPKLLKKLEPLNIDISKLTLPEGIKDPNEYIQNGGDKADFQQLLDHRLSLTIKENKPPEPLQGMIHKDQDQLIFKYDDINYRVKGYVKEKNALKLILTAYRDELKYLDRIDLYSDRQRQNFAKSVEVKCKTQSSKIEKHLMEMLFELEQIDTSEDKPKTITHEINSQDKAAALQLLKDKKLMQRILKDITTLGYVGQDKEKLLLYLSATARITENPIHVSIQAASSSGKSAMMESVISLFPPENVEHFSRLSGQSLYYMDSLKNKIIIVDERCGAEEAEMALRSLMSRNRLDLAVVQKDDKGNCKTKIIEIEGPTTVWDSTTHTISEDNRNRTFECFMDESQEQTERVQAQERGTFLPDHWDNENQVRHIRSIHQNAQRLLKPINVSIPYNDLIEFPSMSTRSRRDFKRFLHLIATVALLHQHQREIKQTAKGIDYLEATVDDYFWAYKIVHEILEHSYSLLSRESQKLFEILQRCVKQAAETEGLDIEDYRFSRRDIRLWTRWSDTKVRQHLSELLRMEILRCESGGRGRGGFRYKLTVGNDLQTNLNLIHPDELRRKLKNYAEAQ